MPTCWRSFTPIWHTRSQTARTVRLRIGAVLEWAIAMDWRTDNPCDRIRSVLGPQHDVVQHHRALPHREVAAAIDTLAFEFLMLTTTRGGEVRGAVWSEIDRTESVWTVPAGRMETGREHRVPLCGRALEILDAAWSLPLHEGFYTPAASTRRSATSRPRTTRTSTVPPEAILQHRNDRCLATSLTPLGGDTSTHIRHRQPQQLTVRESGAGPSWRREYARPSATQCASAVWEESTRLTIAVSTNHRVRRPIHRIS